MCDVYLVVEVCEENFFEVDIIDFICIFCGYYVKKNRDKEYLKVRINEEFQLVLICLLLLFVEECFRDLKNMLFGECELMFGLYKFIIVKFFVIFGRYFKVVLFSREYFFYCL